MKRQCQFILIIKGELAHGNLKNRTAVVSKLNISLAAKVAWNSEIIRMIDQRRILGDGTGWINSQLLAFVLLTGCRFWTLNRQGE